MNEEQSRLDEDYGAVNALALRYLRANFERLSPEDAEDIAQEVCFLYWHQSQKINCRDAWVVVATRHRALDWLKARRHSTPVEERHLAKQPQNDPRAEGIREQFMTLRAHCRQLLGCLYIAGYSISELVATTGRSARQLYDQRARCLKSLRQRWLLTESQRSALPTHAPLEEA